MGVFLLYGRFFLFRKKSRKLNFLRVAHFVRNNKDINETTGYFRLFILYIRNSLYLKKIVSWYFGYLIKSAKVTFAESEGSGEKTKKQTEFVLSKKPTSRAKAGFHEFVQ